VAQVEIEYRTQIKELRNKVEKLINLHERMMHEHQLLIKEQDQQKIKIREQQQLIAELEEKNRIIRLGNMVSGSDQNTREIKLKINEYIREIDRCLALINR
jgi:phage-related minor tail protein